MARPKGRYAQKREAGLVPTFYDTSSKRFNAGVTRPLRSAKPRPYALRGGHHQFVEPRRPRRRKRR